MSSKIRAISAGIMFADVGCDPIDRCPGAGDLVPTSNIALTLGGCASNVALNLAKLGIQNGVCGCLGDDMFSDFILSALRHPLIETGHVRRVSNSAPGCTLIVNVKGEDRRFISTTGANAQFRLSDIPKEWGEEAEVIYLGGFLMMPFLESEETADFFRSFRARGGKVILDVVLYGARPYWDALKPLMPLVDYFMPNNDEARLICGLTDPVDQAKFFMDAGAAVSVITCGEEGAIFYSQHDKFRTGTFPVNFIGGAGSGDAFAAGFVAGLLEKEAPIDLMRRASAQGMSCVRHSSTTQSIFNRQELEDWLAGNNLKIEPLS